MKIAFFELEDWQKEEVKERLGEHELQFFDEPLSDDNVSEAEDADAIAIFIYSEASEEILSRFENLKLISTMSTGFDHIDLEYCKENEITVCNVPTYGENTVAEHTFALILALSRKLYPSIERTREEHTFQTDRSLRGFDLKDKTLGIIGCGNIGQHTARMANGFEMNIKVFDVNQNPELAEKIGFEYVDMDELLSTSNIITLHVPLNKHTYHMIDEEAIEKMKEGVYIVNTSRGEVIDTNALVEGLQNGEIAGAGLDVLEGEGELQEEAAVLKQEYKEEHDLRTLLQDHMMMKMDNVIITPHNAFNSREALMRILNTTIENVQGFDSGNVVNEVS